jgi:hypothetical protein
MDDFDYSWQQHRDELYSRVVRRGRSIKAQRRAIMSAVVAIVVAIPVAGAYAATNAPHGHAEAFATTTWPQPDGGSPSTTATVPTTTPSTIAAPQGHASTTTLPAFCHNSFDYRCGPFSFTSPPPTTPFIRWSSPTVHATAGTPVSIALEAAAPVIEIQWGDGGSDSYGNIYLLPSECTPMGSLYGPWTTPPAPRPRPAKIKAHTYTRPGAYVATARASGLCPPEDWLPGAHTATVTVIVDPSPASSTSSSTSTTPPPSSTAPPPQGP